MLKKSIDRWKGKLKTYERHISAAAMLGGFAFDSFAYGRVDHAVTQTLLIVYLGVAALSTGLLHWLEAHDEWDHFVVRNLRAYLPALTQFVLGSLWSAFLVFYARSGTVAASWPFLIVLAAIFIGNEVFSKYYARLIFTTTLLYFALISYAVFMVPVFTHTIGKITFMLSGAAATLLFAGFLWVLGKLSQARFGEVKWKIAGAALCVYLALNGLYFLNVLPPLPLAMQTSGVYQAICKVPARKGAPHCIGEIAASETPRVGKVYYAALEEPQSWMTWLGFPRTVHIEEGKPVVVFGAIFAPVNLNTSAQYLWQHYDEAAKEWKTVQKLELGLRGGRDKGYRGYTFKSAPEPGRWRVDFVTVDGRLIGRVGFTVESGSPPQALKNVTL
ncbi:hypothetical protein FHS83_000843 [Rhizomicrobium palustre]|uniref:DUF2914 domain-containing protein n=1 Tax=Rhizomicrobium palustre TaxID=189966 RepID=A0A846MWC9_9PROT|nr:DUF2914 domain-containing protein [Rhizomicrobium palustre]NIK87525.1 hypothetical protein [Rhizomicrobium palustre]